MSLNQPAPPGALRIQTMQINRTVNRSALRYFGGKWALAPWIIEHMPAHRVYVEPFGGAASVLLRKPRSKVEVYNEIDDEIVGIFRILQNPAQCRELFRLLRRTPYARREFEIAFQKTDDPLLRAQRAIIRAYMSFHHTALFFVDPPYVACTRRMSAFYRHEMNDAAHLALLEKLKTVKGRVMISGYASALYDDTLTGWQRLTHRHYAAASGAKERTEVLWISG
jgi:DNA adenine methylase